MLNAKIRKGSIKTERLDLEVAEIFEIIKEKTKDMDLIVNFDNSLDDNGNFRQFTNFDESLNFTCSDSTGPMGLI